MNELVKERVEYAVGLDRLKESAKHADERLKKLEADMEKQEDVGSKLQAAVTGLQEGVKQFATASQVTKIEGLLTGYTSWLSGGVILAVVSAVFYGLAFYYAMSNNAGIDKLTDRLNRLEEDLRSASVERSPEVPMEQKPTPVDRKDVKGDDGSPAGEAGPK